jgi:hypothetical protein
MNLGEMLSQSAKSPLSSAQSLLDGKLTTRPKIAREQSHAQQKANQRSQCVRQDHASSMGGSVAQSGKGPGYHYQKEHGWHCYRMEETL